MRKIISILFALFIVTVAATTVSASDYEVEKGDSLWKIANEHHTTVETLMEINELDSSLIYPKQILKIEAEEIRAEYYQVQKGDTLTKISESYGEEVTVKSLKEWNNLSSDLIITGQYLLVNGMEAVPDRESEVYIEESTAEDENAFSHEETPVDAVEKTETNQTESHQTTETPTEVKEEVVEETEPSPVAEEQSSAEESSAEVTGNTFSVEATAYTAGCSGCSGITATGINLNNNPHAKVIAVDPNVIPLGTEVYVEGYGYAVAGDTGGAINGNKIDIHVPTKQEAYNWGRRTVEITIVE